MRLQLAPAWPFLVLLPSATEVRRRAARARLEQAYEGIRSKLDSDLGAEMREATDGAIELLEGAKRKSEVPR